jgi:hypothetical protein
VRDHLIVAEVDPDDDCLRRYIVCWYRYDSARRERRHCVVAAYDSEAEMLDRFAVESQNLRSRQRSGDADDFEHISGQVKKPGAKAEADANRLRRKRFVRNARRAH